jgi:hypothetical protein
MADIDVSGPTAARGRVWERTGFRLSWGAIFAGFVIATVLQVALSLLGIGLGFLGWNPGDPLAALGTGTLIWVIVTAIITLFIGGMVTGRLAGVLTRGDGALHGVVMWALSTLFAVWLVWKMISYLLGSALGIVGGAVSTTAGAVAGGVAQAGASAIGQAGGINVAAIRREIDTALRQTGNPALRPESVQARAEQVQGAAVSPESNQALANDIAAEIQRTAGKVRREDLVNLIAARTHLTRPEAERLADRVEALAGSAQQQVDTLGARAERTAENVAQDVKRALVRMSWLALLAMGLSVAAAAWGATMTARE